MHDIFEGSVSRTFAKKIKCCGDALCSLALACSVARRKNEKSFSKTRENEWWPEHRSFLIASQKYWPVIAKAEKEEASAAFAFASFLCSLARSLIEKYYTTSINLSRVRPLLTPAH
jgi:hypothetical protein